MSEMQDVEYVPAHVIVGYDRWLDIMDDLRELSRLREVVKEYQERDREYLTWSLSGGPLENALAMFKAGRDSVAEGT
jgi:hypothetical protein